MKKTFNLSSMTWVLTRVNGKIASVAQDYSGLKHLTDYIVRENLKGIDTITTEKLSMSELQAINATLSEDDIILFGTPFQKKVWTELFRLGHDGSPARVVSYSEFSEMCGNRPGLRAVAHAVGLNPLIFIIPCHRIVPLASIREVESAYESAVDTLFQGRDLNVFNAFDFGEFSLGRQMKRELLAYELLDRE